MPSGDSTPRASGFDSRCSPRSWLTSGGPSSRRLVEYQKVSGKPALRSSRPIALRVATGDLRLSSGLYAFGGAGDFLPLQPVWAIRAALGAGPAVACLGEDYPISCLFTRTDSPSRERHDHRLSGQT